jgi:hypothetical protein
VPQAIIYRNVFSSMDNKMVKHLLIMLVMPSNEHVKVKLNDAPNIMG